MSVGSTIAQAEPCAVAASANLLPARGEAEHRSLSALLIKLGALEFFAIAFSAYLASTLYHLAVWHEGPVVVRYAVAACAIATLVLVVSTACRHFSSIQIQ